MSETNLEIPFFGAGHAHYFEWAEVHVRFAREPSPEERRALLALLPPVFAPEQDDAGDALITGRMLTVGAGQFVNMLIERAYGDGAPPPEEYAEFYVSAEAAQKFEDAIEAWLRASHQVCPIEFAVRAEDSEAGGTALSAWHEASVARGAQVVDAFVNDPSWIAVQGKERERLVHALSVVFDYCGIEPTSLPEELVRTLFPLVRVERAFARGALGEGLAVLRQLVDDPQIAWHRIVRSAFHAALEASRFADALTLLRFGVEQKDIELVATLLRAWLKAVPVESELQSELVRALSGHTERSGHYKDCDSMIYLNEIAAVAHAWMTQAKWEQAIALFRLALQIECSEPAVTRLEPFCNALFPLQYDNSQLPIDAERNAWFLERCLPYAPNNPAIYFNALCLYVEMEDFAEAAALAKLAEQHGYTGLENMKKEIASSPMFAKFRASSAYVS